MCVAWGYYNVVIMLILWRCSIWMTMIHSFNELGTSEVWSLEFAVCSLQGSHVVVLSVKTPRRRLFALLKKSLDGVLQFQVLLHCHEIA